MKLFIADLNQIINNGDFISTAKARLLQTDLKRFQNFKNTHRALQFLVGRFLITTHVSPDYQTLETGKVVIKNGYISLAHSKNIVVLALHTSPVGVDIENIKERKNYKRIAKRMNFPACHSYLDFLKSWTAYEANFKLKIRASNISYQYITYQDFLICTATSQTEQIKITPCFL